MTEIYFGGSFSIETKVKLTSEQVDKLYHELDGLLIFVTIPGEIAEMLDVNSNCSSWIDEVEILN